MKSLLLPGCFLLLAIALNIVTIYALDRFVSVWRTPWMFLLVPLTITPAQFLIVASKTKMSGNFGLAVAVTVTGVMAYTCITTWKATEHANPMFKLVGYVVAIAGVLMAGFASMGDKDVKKDTNIASHSSDSQEYSVSQ
jgi:hypothetical protein